MSIKVKTRSAGQHSKEFMYKNPCHDEDPIDIRNIKVLTKNDWNRIQQKLHQREIDLQREQLEKEKKEKIKQCSQNLVKNWTNTVLKGSGARQKKLEERKARLEKEEKARQQIDLEEAEFQAEKRRKAIEEAKRKQYFQTDRVKNFHSALLYSEVLKERSAQMELKQLRELAECNKDDEYIVKVKREFEEGIKADQERAEERIRKAKQNAEFVKSQIKHHMSEVDKERQQELTEGENIRRLAIAHALEKQRLEQIDREEKRLLRQEYMQQIQDVHNMRTIEQLKSEEDDEEIRIFAAAKKKMMKLRIQKEKEIHDEKQRNLENIKDKLSAQMKLKMDDEDDRIKVAIVEKEEKFVSDEAEKRRKRMEMQKAMDENRIETMNRLLSEKRDAQRRDLDALLARREADAVLRQNEAHRHRVRQEDAKKLAAENLEMAKNFKASDEYSHENQLKVQAENQKLLDLEEQVFQEYAARVINHCEKGGRNTYPMRVAAMKGFGGGLGPILPGSTMKPSYKSSDGQETELSNWQTGATKETKDNIDCGGNSSNNLGFVWTEE